MKRKGISPLIAAVLLIAFTMAIASIFAQWAPQLMQDAQGESKEKAKSIQECSDRTLDVEVDTSDNTATIQQTGGNEGVGNLTLTWRWQNNDPTQNTTDATTQISRDNPVGITTISSGYPSREATELNVQAIDCDGAPGGSWEP